MGVISPCFLPVFPNPPGLCGGCGVTAGLGPSCSGTLCLARAGSAQSAVWTCPSLISTALPAAAPQGAQARGSSSPPLLLGAIPAPSPWFLQPVQGACLKGSFGERMVSPCRGIHLCSPSFRHTSCLNPAGSEIPRVPTDLTRFPTAGHF